MKKTAFLTTIFPMKKCFIVEFFQSLREQTYQAFDIIVINDGFEEFEQILLMFNDLNITELKHAHTPAKNREFGINYVKENNYDILIFGDSDDLFQKNRVAFCIKELSSQHIIINDLTLFKEGQIIVKDYISKRFADNSPIHLEDILEKNIFGMSNTAIQVSILEELEFDQDLVAIDWYLYSSLLLRGFRAVFTNKTTTFYRQHSSNTVGLGSLTSEAIIRGLSVKLKHYQLLENLDNRYKTLYQKMIHLRKKIKSEGNSSIDNIINQNKEFPLWWEGIQ